MVQGRSLDDTSAYTTWAAEHDVWLTKQQRLLEAQLTPVLSCEPQALFTICIVSATSGPNYNEIRAIQQLTEQSFQAWEAFVSDDSVHALRCSRLRPLPSGMGIVDQCEFAVRSATGRYLIIVPPRALLNRFALWFFASAALSGNRPEVIYSDSDRLDNSKTRIQPQFRTGWDPEVILSYAYIGDVYAVSIELVRQIGGYRDFGDITGTLHDIILRAQSRHQVLAVHHLPAVLWHSLQGMAQALSSDTTAIRVVVAQYISRTGSRASIEHAPHLAGASRLRWELSAETPLVTVIIPTRDKADILGQCARGLLGETDYPSLEVLIVDNMSQDVDALDLLTHLASDARVNVLHYPGNFNFAAMNNQAVNAARGEIVVFLNNDIKIIRPDWLTEMVALARRKGVGAVGAKLYYPDGRVQHCGVSIGPDGVFGHQYRLADPDDPGPLGELVLCRTVQAVTGACMAVRKSVFLEVGGFDETRFKVAFNDIDFCLRLGDYGYRVLLNPNAELIHLESATRGFDDTPKKKIIVEEEYASFRNLWDSLLDGNRFYSPHVQYQWDDTVLISPIVFGLIEDCEVEGKMADEETGSATEENGHVVSARVDEEAILRAASVVRTQEARREAARLRRRLDLLTSHVDEHRQANNSLEAKIADLEAELVAKGADLERSRRQYQQIAGSTIWRASWPLRFILEKLRFE